MVALVIFAGSHDIMGEFRTSALIRSLAIIGAIVVLTLTFVLLADVFGFTVPCLAG